ncbi:hypothetical protein ColTof4_02356 [Colletotrichum tofieldiae]|nr:hypothetical protein ColTof3_09356 [Colletotrichum tofieldiae]GKT69933.1 hypothetical protein ColTof4_02356 [Colletotrichum tofieldiae]
MVMRKVSHVLCHVRRTLGNQGASRSAPVAPDTGRLPYRGSGPHAAGSKSPISAQVIPFHTSSGGLRRLVR